MKDTKTKPIIIMLLIMMVVIVSVITVLYVATDMFKTSETLFKKYVGQNLKDIFYVFDISEEEASFDRLQNEDFSENANITLKYLEDQNDKEEVFNLEEEGVIENVKEKSYRNIKVSYNDEELSKIELLKENELYGFRFSNLVQQFISIKNENLPYFVASLGENGDYFSEKLGKISLSGLFNFSIDEINTISKNYTDAIFKDISTDAYSTKHNVIITLSNKESVTANAHTLTVNKNELDKIYKRVLNEAVKDEIILSKLEEVDLRINDMGINKANGKSLKEYYVSKIQEIIDSIEYEGTEEQNISFTVYEVKGKVVRISVNTAPEEYQYILETDNKLKNTVYLQVGKASSEGMDIKEYQISKFVNGEGYSKTFSYINNDESLDISLATKTGESELQVEGELNYTSNNIYSINSTASAKVTFGTGSTSQLSFNDNNNIVLNNYEGDKIPGILENLKNRFIKKLEDSQSKVNSKLLNNILNWVYDIEQKREEDRQNETQLEKEKFNNQFTLYAGENLKLDHVQKMMEVVSQNMAAYKAISGSKVRIAIKEGAKNETRAQELVNMLDEKHTYNISVHKSKDGYVQYIDIEVYKKPEKQ